MLSKREEAYKKEVLEEAKQKFGPYTTRDKYKDYDYWGSTFTLGRTTRCAKCQELNIHANHYRFCPNNASIGGQDMKNIYYINHNKINVSGENTIENYNAYANGGILHPFYLNNSVYYATIIHVVGVLSVLGITYLTNNMLIFYAYVVVAVIIGMNTHRYLMANNFNKLYNICECTHRIGKNYYFDNLSEATHICKELNTAMYNHQPETVHTIITNILALDNNAEHSMVINTKNAMNEEIDAQNYNTDEIFTKLSNTMNKTPLLSNRDYAIISEIFGDNMDKIDILNETIMRYQLMAKHRLSGSDRNVLANCKAEYLGNIEEIVNIYNLGVSVNNDVRVGFLELVNNCLSALSSIEDSINKEIISKINVSNNFLGDKFNHGISHESLV